jgi:hypothetical protein
MEKVGLLVYLSLGDAVEVDPCDHPYPMLDLMGETLITLAIDIYTSLLDFFLHLFSLSCPWSKDQRRRTSPSTCPTRF